MQNYDRVSTITYTWRNPTKKNSFTRAGYGFLSMESKNVLFKKCLPVDDLQIFSPNELFTIMYYLQQNHRQYQNKYKVLMDKIIGASVSEPHTSELNCNFSYIYKIFIQLSFHDSQLA